MSDFQSSVTVVIPSREIDFYLRDCIYKIRNLYPVVKIICIVDEYTEEQTAEFDENIKFLKSENKNMSAKRNLGVNNSDTEYVAFIDSDAYPIKGLKFATEFLQKNEEYAAVTGCQLLPPDDSFQRECLRIVRFSEPFTYPEWSKVIDTNTKEQDCSEFMTSNLVMRKSHYLAVGGMNENIYLAEDNEFSERLSKAGYKIRFIPDVQVFHHEASFFPFMRKIFCMGFYYANTLINRNHFQRKRHYILMFIPLALILVCLVLFFEFLSISKFLNLLMIFMLFILCLFVILALKFCQKLKDNKLKGFFLFIIIFTGFCASYITGQLLGLFNFKNIKVQNLYRHY